MNAMIDCALVAIGGILVYAGSKNYIGAYADTHPNITIFVGLALILGAKAIANKINKQ
jgi:hypothetical protein